MHPTRIFKQPEELANAFEEYKENLKEQANEWLKVDYVGKDGKRVTEAQKVPMTLEGFKRYCRTNYGEVGQYFDNKDGYFDDFVVICLHIREEIRENQVIGGLLGFFNPSITQRLNGLTDKTETKQEINLTGVEVSIKRNRES